MDIISRNMNVTKWGSTPGESFFLQQRYLANIGPPPPLPPLSVAAPLAPTGGLTHHCACVRAF
jgi:hypothetical protein